MTISDTSSAASRAAEEMFAAEAIVRRAKAAFVGESALRPILTLRGGNAVDSYLLPEPYDEAADQPSDAYLEAHTFWGLAHLDAASWRHYLPVLIDYTLRHTDDLKMVAEGLLHNLRPPDRQPPRLASLNEEQEAVIAAFLEHLCFAGGESPNRDFACQVLEEWWLPDSLYRRRER